MDVTLDRMADEINKQLKEYGNAVFKHTNEGLDKAQGILINTLARNSPKGKGKYSKGWKEKTGKKYGGRRYVGNTSVVKGAKSDTIPLSNILEFKKVGSRPHIQRTVDSVAEQMATEIINKLK